MPDEMDIYFSGQKLYGDDFTGEALQQWYDEEIEGYAEMVAAYDHDYTYHYHELNKYKLFGRISIEQGVSALGIGSAYGEEFFPILDKLGKLTIVDPSDEFANNTSLRGVPVEYVKPALDGSLSFNDNSFDIITAFGSLHHIATVSNVMRNCYRCLKPGGFMLTREPIVTQGDWRRKRGTLTKNERGIPYGMFQRMATDAGFSIRDKTLFDFAPFAVLMDRIGVPICSNPITTRVDHLISLLFSFNKKYHRTRFLEKFGPASMTMILQKPEQSA